MIYLDHAATAFHKPEAVYAAVVKGMRSCANPGRGGYEAAMEAARVLYACRETAAELFDCRPEQVVLTSGCTHGLNIAIRSVAKPGARVVVSGFEHNAVVRPLYALGAKLQIAGRKLFDREDTLRSFRQALDRGVDAAVFTHVSNVFGYRLPVEEMAFLCKERGIPFVIDAAQSAGCLPLQLQSLGADFIAIPGHKGLLGPQGTGLLLCAGDAEPLMQGGTGAASISREMPKELPERLEAGTQNVPGFAGLIQGLRYLKKVGIHNILRAQQTQQKRCAEGLAALGYRVFAGEEQTGVLSFLSPGDCEETAREFAQQGIALRAGLHCAPLAHESAGTIDTGTLRLSFGHDANKAQTEHFLRVASKLSRKRK